MVRTQFSSFPGECATVTPRRACAWWCGGVERRILPSHLNEIGSIPGAEAWSGTIQVLQGYFSWGAFPCEGKCSLAALAPHPGVACLGLKRREDFDSGFALEANSLPSSGWLCFTVPPFSSRLFTPPQGGPSGPRRHPGCLRSGMPSLQRTPSMFN